MPEVKLLTMEEMHEQLDQFGQLHYWQSDRGNWQIGVKVPSPGGTRAEVEAEGKTLPEAMMALLTRLRDFQSNWATPKPKLLGQDHD